MKPSSLPDDKIEIINDTHGTNIDPFAEKKLLRKCDIHVLPPLFVLFLLAFLDRVNIGKSTCTYLFTHHANDSRQRKDTGSVFTYQ